ncbi:MAG: tRNA dimethylallyltransferase [Berkelbacteria bacterium GW2011_GWA1_39_10]|uniref:tRNA dimethylallyltransferase n=1 Tax=Berkelbacteria bacterium GW2011_GWA1_39_10 TaxID=1618332 RepID=A0A0G0LFX5_9BACT|nr:MAG: tRNA dimethylallyltransferase [Berkelbacteria bacterium GW2011_GWA1_39_10]
MPDTKKIIRLGSARLVAIVGPTGSGKTSWAKILAQKFNGKVITADSRQVYIGMDIGTGKDKSFQQDLIDIIYPDKIFSVADYQKKAEELIAKYQAQNILPVIAGGTGLYIESVLYGYVIPDLKKESLKLRQSFEKLKDTELIKKLQQFDSISAKKIDPKNRRRIIRALEVSILTKNPFSKLQKKKPKYDSLIIGIDVDRETLYSKIDARIEEMVKSGLVEEVRNLLKKYREDLPAMSGIGYKEIIDYLKGRKSLRESIQKIKFNTHAYVRRQMTWFRRDKNIYWVQNINQAEKLIEKFLSK